VATTSSICICRGRADYTTKKTGLAVLVVVVVFCGCARLRGFAEFFGEVPFEKLVCFRRDHVPKTKTGFRCCRILRLLGGLE